MDRIEIPLSKKKQLLLLIAAAIFVSLGVLFVVSPELFAGAPYYLSPPLVQLLGILSIVFFGTAGVYTLRKMGDKRAGLIIDDDGIYDNTNAASIGLIKWDDIIKMETEKIHSTKLLFIYVKNPDEYINRAKGVRKKLMQANKNMYGTPLSITSTNLKCNMETLQQLLVERINGRNAE